MVVEQWPGMAGLRDPIMGGNVKLEGEAGGEGGGG